MFMECNVSADQLRTVGDKICVMFTSFLLNLRGPAPTIMEENRRLTLDWWGSCSESNVKNSGCRTPATFGDWSLSETWCQTCAISDQSEWLWPMHRGIVELWGTKNAVIEFRQYVWNEALSSGEVVWNNWTIDTGHRHEWQPVAAAGNHGSMPCRGRGL